MSARVVGGGALRRQKHHPWLMSYLGMYTMFTILRAPDCSTEERHLAASGWFRLRIQIFFFGTGKYNQPIAFVVFTIPEDVFFFTSRCTMPAPTYRARSSPRLLHHHHCCCYRTRRLAYPRLMEQGKLGRMEAAQMMLEVFNFGV